MSFFDWIKKRKQQRLRDKAINAFAEAFKTANDKNQQMRPILKRNQFVWEPNYGLDKTNPIISESLQGTANYLGRLCTPDGKTFTWSHYVIERATVHGLPDVGEDKYTLYLNGQPYTDVYFVPYIGRSKYPPAGLHFVDEKKDWVEERLAAKRRYDETGSVIIESEDSDIIYF